MTHKIAKTIPDLKFLESLRDGKDPRFTSKLYDLVMSIDDGFGDTLPTVEQWHEIVSIVMSQYRAAKVPLSISFAAAKELAQYKRAKLKAIEHKNNSQNNATVDELTKEEIKLFKRVFDSEF